MPSLTAIHVHHPRLANHQPERSSFDDNAIDTSREGVFIVRETGNLNLHGSGGRLTISECSLQIPAGERTFLSSQRTSSAEPSYHSAISLDCRRPSFYSFRSECGEACSCHKSQPNRSLLPSGGSSRSLLSFPPKLYRHLWSWSLSRSQPISSTVGTAASVNNVNNVKFYLESASSQTSLSRPSRSK